MMQSNRQEYPDFLRATSIAKIVIFHFFSWQLLTYIPSLGIMFALGGWFIANSFSNKPTLTVIYNRLVRLLPTWWAFSLLTLTAGFFYAQGANISLQTTFAWLVPYQQATWSLDNSYANDAVVVTWYIAAYLWLMLLSPLLLYVYKKLSWVVIFLPVIGMIVYSNFYVPHQTLFGDTMYNVLTFCGCWMLGFIKADNSINKIPRYIIWGVTISCVTFGIYATYNTHVLSDNPVALSVMSFGIAMLLLSFNPDFTQLPSYVKSVTRLFNTYAVTIYLFHNILINGAFKIGDYIGVYRIGDYLGVYNYDGRIGQLLCFIILIVLVYVTVKTIGIIETQKWERTKSLV